MDTVSLLLKMRGGDKRGLFKTSHGERHENLSPRAYWFKLIWASQNGLEPIRFSSADIPICFGKSAGNIHI